MAVLELRDTLALGHADLTRYPPAVVDGLKFLEREVRQRAAHDAAAKAAEEAAGLQGI